jgi:hypothetical protein
MKGKRDHRTDVKIAQRCRQLQCDSGLPADKLISLRSRAWIILESRVHLTTPTSELANSDLWDEGVALVLEATINQACLDALRTFQ